MNFGWVGAATDDGFTVAFEVTGPVDVRLAVSTSSDMSSPTFSSTVTDADGWHKLAITGLSANTEYFWSLEEDSVVGAAEGSIRTFPTEGSVTSFAIAAASCCQSNTNPNTFVRIRNRAPAFFMHMGDFNYEDINVNDTAAYEAAYELTLGQSNQAALYKNIPTFYMWDDHDYATNNSDGSAIGRPAALSTYRKVVPHPPISFVGDDDDTPVSYTFVCGRVRFVQLDMRSDADFSGTPSTNALIGTTQLNWLVNIIETFTEELLVIDVSVPWIIGVGEKVDTWGNATTERTAISDAIQDHAQGRVLLIHGDSHMVAMDDGSNTNYATTPSGPGPRLCCFAPLNRSNSVKGGPYSEGTFAGSTTQYGVLDFFDSGGAITVTATGYDASDDSELVSMVWKVGDGAASDQIIYWAEDVTEADAFPAGTVAYVKTDGANPTRVRLNNNWWNIDTILLNGLPYTLDSVVEVGVEGEGVLQAQRATVVGVGTREITGSGALEAPLATVDGSGGIKHTAVGELAADRGEFVAFAVRIVTAGDVELVADRAVVQGTAVPVNPASGALVASRAGLSGEAQISPESTGSGALQAGAAVVQADVLQGIVISAELVAGRGSVQAIVGRTINVVGALKANPVSITTFAWAEQSPTQGVWVTQFGGN